MEEFCFLCLNTTQLKIVSLLGLRRHLKINTGSTDENVTLCDDCNKVISRFTTLFLQLEKIQMEMDYQLGRIHNFINNGKDDHGRVKSNPSGMIHTFREEIRIKCSAIKSKSPSVNLTRLKRQKDVRLIKTENEDFAETCPSLAGSDLSSEPNEVSNESLNTLELEGAEDSTSLKRVKRDSKTGKFNCSKCTKSFKKKNSLKVHFESVHLGKTWKCDVCISTFQSSRSLLRHKKSCKDTIKTRQAREHFNFICDTCGKRFPVQYLLRQHMLNIHSASKTFPCDQCDKKFKSLFTLKYHKLAIHAKKTANFCKYCGRRFTHLRNCKDHEKTCTKKEPTKTEGEPDAISFTRDLITGRIPCPACSTTFAKGSNARQHYASVHLKRKLTCDICNVAKYSQLSSLNRHKQDCRQKSLQQDTEVNHQIEFLCSDCGKRFKRRRYLNTHQNTVHSKDRDFTCELCGKSFKNNAGLNSHKDQVHLKKSYHCKYCNQENITGSVHFAHERKCLKRLDANVNLN